MSIQDVFVIKVTDTHSLAHLLLEHAGENLLTHYIRSAVSNLSNICRQLLSALEHLHSHDVIHNDIKPPNIYIDESGHVRLGDFGSAFVDRCGGGIAQTPKGTSWYYPPEVLLRAHHWGSPVDIWATGCTMAELALRRPLFQGANDTEQLLKMFEQLGTPVGRDLADLRRFPGWCMHFASKAPRPWPVELIHQVGTYGIDLLSKLCALGPTCRPTAEAACAHPFLLPCDGSL